MAVSFLVYFVLVSNQNTENVNNTIVDLQKNEKAKLYAADIIAECERDKNCLVEMLWELSNKENQQTVLTTVGDILSIYDKDDFYCHRQAHHLGMFLYSYTKNLDKALLSADRNCGGSVYHGIMETFFMSEEYGSKDTEINEPEITKLCDVIGVDPQNIIRMECVHGVGHGLMKSLNHDVFSVVERCDEFDERIEQVSCYEGTFMENVREYFETGEGSFDADDMLYPCNKLDDNYATECYLYHTSYILKKTDSITEAFNVCNQLDLPSSVHDCYVGIGRQMSLNYLDDMKDFLPICKKGSLEYIDSCLIGGLLTIADQIDVDAAYEACRSWEGDVDVGACTDLVTEFDIFFGYT